ncbi:MAG: Calx-beta domain-containing protein, partial [Pseudomonadota bacterium]|nr:Calx-beta domain-containing protein [Pseudomonadota bacterium]
TVTDNDSTEVSLSPATLSFGPDNWSVAQTVVVSGVADSFDDGNQTSTITIASDNSTSDVKYDGLSSGVIVTIQDNDTATVTIDNVSVSENATTATMVLRLTNAVSSSFTVNVSTSDGSARSSQYDYTAISSQTVSFAGNDNETQSVSISLTDDSQVEGSETVTLRMVSVSNSGVDISDTGTLTITDNDVATVTIADVSASESGGTATVTLVSDQSYGPGFTLDVSTADGTAFSPDDYTAVSSQTVSFAGNAGEQQTVSITLKSDTSIEGDESFTVSMSNPSNSEVLDISDNATVTITDDDTATLTIADRTVNEGDNVTLTLSLSSAPALPWTVVVSTVDGSAVAGSSGDYTSFSETVSFGFGVTSKTISIASIEDSLAEDNETFVVRLDNSSVSSVNITDNATVTIIDDEARPEVTLTPSASTVSEGSGTLTLTATQSQLSAANTVVSLSFSGNATRSGDYSVSENITIAGGSLSGNVTLSLIDDNTTEASEAIVVD